MKRQLPKNVRQIGNVSDSSKIYVEDYVDTFFNQLCEKADQKPVGAFLIGEIVQEEEEDYIYVQGAIQMKELIQKGRDVFVNENTWKNACETCKEYFGNAEILGWFLATTGQPLEVNHNIVKVHQKLFPREKSIFIIKEAREKEEKYFIHKYKDLMECQGHYVFYEKNVEMQDYMIASRKKMGMTPSEIIEDTVTKNFRSVIREKMDKGDQKTRSRYVYAFSTFLVLLVLVIGVTMINNYDKMRDAGLSLSQLGDGASDLEDEEVVETIGNIVQSEMEDDTEGTEAPTDQEQLETLPEDETFTENQETLEGQEGQAENPSENETEGQTENQEGSTSEEPQNDSETAEVYTVQKGDTLAVISRKIYGDSSKVKEICELNGLEDGNLIFIGQKLMLP